jgi:uncharacterized protein YecE (DUF72 family)
MKEGKVHIGTSGWSYRHWKGNFYPENLPQKDWLQFYIDKGFLTVEVNSPFYHLPYKSTFEKWRDSVPKDFLFSVKASRYITHIKKLHDARESIKKFFDSAKELNEKLGPVLFQLPPGWKFDRERLANFLKNLSNKYRYTFEFRNNTWWNDEAFDLLKYNNISFCIYELEGTITPKETTADFVYIRLHGPGKKYQGDYNIKTLSDWADSCIKWKGEGKDIFCYFDNDQNGFAAKNALELKILTEKN